MSFRGRVPKLCKRQLSARPGVAISYSPSIPPRRPVIKSLNREGRLVGGVPFYVVRRCGEAAVWRRAVRRCGEKRYCGVAETAVWRRAVRRNGEKRYCGVAGASNGGVAEMRCGGVAETADAAEKLMLWCGKTAVLRNFSAAVVDLIGLWRLADIRAASRAAPVSAFNCGQRSCDQLSPKLAADCDGGGDFRGESFGSPVFSGVRGGKLA